MSANSLDNFVIVFSDPSSAQTGSNFSPLRVPTDISFANRITTDLQTLSTNDADPDGSIQGLLYVPDIPPEDPCYNITQSLVPHNVTRQKDLPDVDFNLIALAPWVSANCTLAYLKSAHFDPIRAFIFYLPDNGTNQPPPISDDAWNLHDGGQWKSQTPYPVYAVPGNFGVKLMTELSFYSGNVSSVPYGNILLDDYGLDPRDYVRIYTDLEVTTSSTLPGLWVFLLIVVGALAVILASTSLMMHWIQGRRRESLRRRVASGDVDLEALGIKRLTVPQNIIDKMPQFIYTCSGEDANAKDVDDTPRNSRSSGSVTKNDTSNSLTPIGSDEPEPHASPTITAHDYLPHSQPTCPICLDDFISGQTTIRSLPCLHIFHPECIDSFLSNNSSLCPMCKKSSLPLGYCPERITNAMVTRERAIRRLRGSIVLPFRTDARDLDTGQQNQTLTRLGTWRAAMNRRLGREQPAPDSREVPPVYTGGATIEMQPVLEVEPNAPRPRELNPHLSRGEIAQLRARELLGGTIVEDEGSMHPGWRRAISRVFPGFK